MILHQSLLFIATAMNDIYIYIYIYQFKVALIARFNLITPNFQKFPGGMPADP